MKSNSVAKPLGGCVSFWCHTQGDRFFCEMMRGIEPLRTSRLSVIAVVDGLLCKPDLFSCLLGKGFGFRDYEI